MYSHPLHSVLRRAMGNHILLFRNIRYFNLFDIIVSSLYMHLVQAPGWDLLLHTLHETG